MLCQLLTRIISKHIPCILGMGLQIGVCKVLDGDMLCQFLELTSTQQESVLSEQHGVITLSQATPSSSCLERSTPVDHVLQLLERVHNSLA